MPLIARASNVGLNAACCPKLFIPITTTSVPASVPSAKKGYMIIANLAYVEKNGEMLRPEEIFAVHPGIRWAGLATRKGQIIFAQMREGKKSLTPNTNDLSALEIRTQYVIEAAEQDAKWSGMLEYISFCFEKFVEVIIPLRNSYVAITVEKDVAPEFYPEIANAIRELNCVSVMV